MDHPKETVRLNFEFPKSRYPDLKYLCAKKSLSIREFMTSMILRELEEAEDEELARVSKERIETRQEDDLIDWNEAKKLAGWE